ncbi:hypothetical protein VE04_07245, partial [Pseudogymnoascus sp. 24MN13]
MSCGCISIQAHTEKQKLGLPPPLLFAVIIRICEIYILSTIRDRKGLTGCLSSGSSQPLGHQSRDINLFKDTDGTAYLLTEDRASGLRIDKLSSDYLSVASEVYTFGSYESPAIYKSGSTYFMFASHLTGW